MLAKGTITATLFAIVLVFWYIITTGMTAGWLYLIMGMITILFCYILDSVFPKKRAIDIEIYDSPKYAKEQYLGIAKALGVGVLVGIVAALFFSHPFFSIGLPVVFATSAMPFDQKLFAIVLIAPLFELFFRGPFQSLVYFITKSFTFAVILSALAFGAYHFYAYSQAAVQVAQYGIVTKEMVVTSSTISAVMFSILLSLANKYTNNIATEIPIHAIVNYASLQSAFTVVAGLGVFMFIFSNKRNKTNKINKMNKREMRRYAGAGGG